MQQTPVGCKNEPIDVDELFNYDGIEEITSPRPGSRSSLNRECHRPETVHRHRRLQKRPRRKTLGSSTENPIALDSDDGDESEVEGTIVPGIDNARKGKAPLALARDPAYRQTGVLTTQSPVNGLSASGINLRLHGLTLPASSPSPLKLERVVGPSNGTLKRETSTSADNSHENPFTKMEVDSTINDLAAAKSEDEWSSADDFWEWSDYMKSDSEDDGLNDNIVIEDSLENLESTPTRRKPPSRKPCGSRVMLKPETSTMCIPTDAHVGRRKSCQKVLRAWHTFGFESYRDKHEPLITDYRQLIRANTGILSQKAPLGRRNVFNCWLNMPPLRLSSSYFKDLRTSGSISKIVQSREFIAVASPAKGGGADPDTSSGPPEVDNYNREGNLIVWRGHKYLSLDGHSRRWPVEDGSLRRSTKYYTVSDVAFDPLRPNRLVSSGYDRAVRVVDLEICGDTFSPRNVHTFEYSQVPYDIAYKPNSSLFAVSCFDGNIYIHKDTSKFPLEASNGRDSRPGTFIWGAHSSNAALQKMLFASTESDKDNVCVHTAFNVERRKAEYELDIYDCSDAMALDPQGRTLALITSNNSDSSHALSLFDVGHNSGERIAGTRPFQLKRDARTNPRLPLETTHAAFSPDGILLALSRSDHRVHVYDVRYLGLNGEGRLWAELEHPPVSRPRNEHEEYGVTGLSWVEGLSFDGRGRCGSGLVTAGADDCVRLWDIMRCPTHTDESMVLAKVDMDVACFSVGDISKNEHRLVVGDCAGEVHIFD